MGWLENWRRGRAIKVYARRLPRLLAKDYGGSDAYTPAQIRASILRHGLDARFESYAVAMLSDRERFAKFRAEHGETRDYDEIRGEAARAHFGADSDLNSLDFLSDSGFAEGGASGHESGDFSGHHGQ
jgi:hypothetical protein